MNPPGDSSRGATVRFETVHKSFGPVHAVKDFLLEVDAGEFLTLLGPSGSGKTTVLNMVAGFLHPSSGEIFIARTPISSLAIEKRNVGMVFQNYSLFPHMSVFENVAFPLKMRYAKRDLVRGKVQSALDLVRLADYGRRMPHELSGGQRQRVAFARAIIFEPKVLLMDEPLGALDLKLREQMQIEIKRYQQEIGCTVIYVTHDQGEALTLSDRIVVMNDGEIIQIGTPVEIYDLPETRFAAEFIGETNILTVSRRGESGSWRVEEADIELAREIATWPATSERAYLSIRPEKIRRLESGHRTLENEISLDARVTEVVFLGDVIRYGAVLPSGKTLIFKEHRTSTTQILHAGDRVRIGFTPRDAVLLEYDRS